MRLMIAGITILVFSLVLPMAAASARPVTLQETDGTRDESAQDGDATSQPQGEADAQSDAAPEEPTVPETFDPLLDDFRTLVKEIVEEGGQPTLKSTEIRELMDRVAQYNNQRIPSQLSVAVQLQLAEWANLFGPAREDIFAHMNAIEVTDPGLRIKWADHLVNTESRPERAIEVLDDASVDLQERPAAIILRAEALFMIDQYADALTTIDALPVDARLTPEQLDRIYELRRDINERRAMWDAEQARLEAERQADDLPRVEITTTKGSFVVELFENDAPNTVANFINLAEEHFYDTVQFHQATRNMMVVTGDPSTREADPGDQGDDQGSDTSGESQETLPGDDAAGGPPSEDPKGPGYRIASEQREDPRVNWTGYLSMVPMQGTDAAGSQFRIALRRLEQYDGRGTVFGRVIDGMRVVRNLEQGDRILATRVIRKRDHVYEPETISLASDATNTSDSASDAPPAGDHDQPDNDQPDNGYRSTDDSVHDDILSLPLLQPHA